MNKDDIKSVLDLVGDVGVLRGKYDTILEENERLRTENKLLVEENARLRYAREVDAEEMRNLRSMIV